MSGFLSLLPLLLFLSFLGIAAWIGYQIYLYSLTLSDRTQASLAKKNVTFNPNGGGLKVGVRDMKAEDYAGKTQGVLVDAWNLSSWPGYKSRLWNKQEKGNGKEKVGKS